MDEFLQLNWGIKEPHELDLGSDFIPEEEIDLSYVYRGITPSKINAEQTLKTNEKQIKQEQVPGHHYNFTISTKSFLNAVEQTKCLMALKLIQSGKKPSGFYQQNCMELYNNIHQQILDENEKFSKFAERQFLGLKSKTFKFMPLLKTYSESLWRYRLGKCKDYKQFYKGIDMLPYSYKEDEEPVEMMHVQNLLELGSVARFSRPTLLKQFHLKKGSMPKTKILYNSNQSVSKDVNIDELLKTNKIDVVISSSGLTRLLNFTKTNIPWDIPVVVKEMQIQDDLGAIKNRKIIFIDKPFINRSPTLFELNEKCAKIFMKSNFCDTEAFSFEKTETPIGTYEIYGNKQTQAGKTNVPEQGSTDNSNNNNKDEYKQRQAIVEDSTANFNNKRKKEINDNQEGNKKIKLDEVQSPCNRKKGTKFQHNVSYRLWKLQLKTEQCELIKSKYQLNSIQVLVRCKLDGCESAESGQLQPIILSPKMEYHLKFGAGSPTKEELIKEWVYAHFRPFSQICRIRTHYQTGEVIAIENCTPHKIALEAQTHHQINPHLGLGVLYKIFNRMLDLIPGNYILHHLPKDGAFVALLMETEESGEGIYDLYDAYDSKNCKINPNKQIKWHPIDVNFILPRHTAENQMPGLFKPRIVTKCINKGKKKRKNKNRNQRKNLNKQNIQSKIEVSSS